MSTPRLVNINFYHPRGGVFTRRRPQIRIGNNAKPWRLFLSGGILDLGFKDFASHPDAISYLIKVTAHHQPLRKAA